MQQHCVGREHAAIGLVRGLFIGVRLPVVQGLPDFQHGGGLHDLFHASRVIHARQLDQNLILPQSVLLNNRLADAQLVHPIPDGLDRLRDGPVFQIRQDRWLHGQGPGILRTRGSVIFRQPVRNQAA